MPKIVIAGGSGFLGQCLTEHFVQLKCEVVVLTRRYQLDRPHIHYYMWNAESLGAWQKQLEEADVLINLTGKSVDCRYTEFNKQEIYHSRLASTYVLGKAIEQCKTPPRLWINSSSATIYADSYTKEMDEYTGRFGKGFSVDVCKKWEQTFYSFRFPKTRQVAIRTAIVLGKNGGAWLPFLQLTNKGFGASQGSGEQYVSWIHETDFCNAISFIIDHYEITGSINLSAPEPIRNKDFMLHIRNARKLPIGIPIPTWLIHFGARLIGTEAELVLKSRRVVPFKLLEYGFQFRFSTLPKAIHSLLPV